MKLTMEKLKKLIKEELQKLEEGLPKSVRDASEEGNINYNNINVKYYYYEPKGEKQDTKPAAIRTQIKKLKDNYMYEDGTYRAVKGGSNLEKQIMAKLKKDPKEWQMLRDDNRSMIFIHLSSPVYKTDAANLIKSGDILHQPQKR